MNIGNLKIKTVIIVIDNTRAVKNDLQSRKYTIGKFAISQFKNKKRKQNIFTNLRQRKSPSSWLHQQ